MSDPKEALERLKIDEIANEAVHQWNAAGNPHLSTGAIGVARIAAEIARAGSIAEREGLEREVARQRDEIEQTRFLITGGEDAPGYAMSLPFSEIERVAHENLATWNYDVERAEAAESKLSALSDKAENVCIAHGMAWDMEGVIGELRALLHPTVPVERDLGSVGSGLTPLVPSPSASGLIAQPSSEYPLHVEELAEAHAHIQRLSASLRDFIDNGAFQVTVGGNPIAVDAMLARAAKALGVAEGWL